MRPLLASVVIVKACPRSGSSHTYLHSQAAAALTYLSSHPTPTFPPTPHPNTTFRTLLHLTPPPATPSTRPVSLRPLLKSEIIVKACLRFNPQPSSPSDGCRPESLEAPPQSSLPHPTPPHLLHHFDHYSIPPYKRSPCKKNRILL
jgi:hypothetical protein